ncbi:putative LRR receptor-like serine/threonine-protein kinase MRH1 [Acorus gramineus]|uniref:LRR receptor-like serine/threonine-protein kinase MRH1 n=1 Tax=Acorus gramineus TaxID=55184 RepID=A0AAV9AM85_ACOGR|nr:putative LRR receptor-like serine/threonine-protein kinase MRH1 [Acorus gramineus]
MAFWVVLVLCLLNQSFRLGESVNDEGKILLEFLHNLELDPFEALSEWNDWIGCDGKEMTKDPCNWFGVECSYGHVVSLTLEDLYLKGTLTPELGKLVYLRELKLRNNSFYGTIPEELGQLQQLNILDVSDNNLSGAIPSGLGNLELLVLDNNNFDNKSPGLHVFSMYSEVLIYNDLSTELAQSALSARSDLRFILKGRRLLQDSKKKAPPPPQKAPNHPPKRPDPRNPAPFPSSAPPPDIPTDKSSPPTSPLTPNTRPSTHQSSSSNNSQRVWIYLALGVGVSAVLSVLGICFFYCRKNKVVTVRPWATGLSGQLQKAFVTGVPSLKRSELEAACEDFSNVIGQLPDCMVYKGTLSSGVEIAVTSTLVTSSKDWSKNCEAQFRKKIETLSKVNHKNFVNLLGFCEESEPFTRMMVFEYAPCGTLFEHLHIREAEQLDWATRLRIAMGIAYCLEHMHQLDPPFIFRTLRSNTIHLTDDYAAKISDLCFNNDTNSTDSPPLLSGPLVSTPCGTESNVYMFGMILLEMISGRVPYSEDYGPLIDWASVYLNGERHHTEMIDPMLSSYREEDVSAMCEVIKSCVHHNPSDRPTMTEITRRLRQITAVAPDGATPKLSPLWWAELEIQSTEGS